MGGAMATADGGTALARRGIGRRGRRASPEAATSRQGLVTHGSGRRRVLDLGPVRDKLGPHWPRYSEAVYLIAEKVIRRELGPKDRHRRDGDAFVIEFEGVSAFRHRRAFAKIEQDLSELLYGAGGALGDVPATRTRRAPARQTATSGWWRRLFAAMRAQLRPRLSRRLRRTGRGGEVAPVAASADQDVTPAAAPAPESSRPTEPGSTEPGSTGTGLDGTGLDGIGRAAIGPGCRLADAAAAAGGPSDRCGAAHLPRASGRAAPGFAAPGRDRAGRVGRRRPAGRRGRPAPGATG